jgi:hypothetical protein
LSKAFEKSNNTASICFPSSEVAQGTVVGPLLFLFFINDLPDIKKSNARLFADDRLLYRVINTKTGQLQLQEDLEMGENMANIFQC